MSPARPTAPPSRWTPSPPRPPRPALKTPSFPASGRGLPRPDPPAPALSDLHLPGHDHDVAVLDGDDVLWPAREQRRRSGWQPVGTVDRIPVRRLRGAEHDLQLRALRRQGEVREQLPPPGAAERTRPAHRRGEGVAIDLDRLDLGLGRNREAPDLR